MLAPNHRWRGEVTPAKRGTGVKPIASTEVRSPAERHVAMSWAHRLKRVFNIDIDVCDRCGESVKVIACVEDQDIIDRILAHLREKEQGRPTLSHLVPASQASPGPISLFAGRESTAPNQQGRYWKTPGTHGCMPSFSNKRICIVRSPPQKKISRRVGESFANFSSLLGTFRKEIYSSGPLFLLYFFSMASS